MLRLIEHHNDAAMTAIEEAVMSPMTSPDVAREALVWLSKSRHFPSYVRRRSVLEVALSHIDSTVRDGAVVGLSVLSDPHSLPALVVSARREPVRELKLDLEELIAQLRNA
jgi:hypothetical protein